MRFIAILLTSLVFASWAQAGTQECTDALEPFPPECAECHIECLCKPFTNTGDPQVVFTPKGSDYLVVKVALSNLDGTPFECAALRPDEGALTVQLKRGSQEVFFASLDAGVLEDTGNGTVFAKASTDGRFQRARVKKVWNAGVYSCEVDLKVWDENPTGNEHMGLARLKGQGDQELTLKLTIGSEEWCDTGPWLDKGNKLIRMLRGPVAP